jgi:hypothetical protein
VIPHEASSSGCGCGSYLFSPNRKHTHPGISRALGASLVSGSTSGGRGLGKGATLVDPPTSLSCLVLSSQPAFSAQLPSFLSTSPPHTLSFDIFSSSSCSSPPPPFTVAFSPRNSTTTLILIPATMDRALDDVVRERSVGSSVCAGCLRTQSANAPEARKQ